MAELTIAVPDEWIEALEQVDRELLQAIVLGALKQHLNRDVVPFDISQTSTWELCGAIEVPAREGEVGDRREEGTTNYAESVDDVLYDRL
ncbi:hypothetical protein [Synechococcus sp. PCC 7336]|uniref:hypothetical protein n=1 Tax=Synechococcus sp. PCC 7336 TaxID=195250 RepID=UPI0003459FD6|nr:hypothetical protein [Synechococcus sp. PCC 7336]